MIIKRDRDDWARELPPPGVGSNPRTVLIDDLLLVELTMHAGYARDLLARLKDALAAWGETEVAAIKVDLPISVAMNRAQIEKLVEKLTAVTT